MKALRRLPGLWIFISVFALMGQMLLPVTHGLAWARQNGDARLLVFCGTGASDAFLSRWKASIAQAHEEARSTSSLNSHAAPACPLCAFVHGLHLTGLPELQLPMLPGFVAEKPRPFARLSETTSRLFLPPSRGPPVS